MLERRARVLQDHKFVGYFPYVIWLYVLLYLCIFGCNKPKSASKPSTVASPPTEATGATGAADNATAENTSTSGPVIDPRIAKLAAKYLPQESITQVKLDSQQFRIDRPLVALKPFLEFKTPLVDFTLPQQANYVEIMRCLASVSLTPATGGTDLAELYASALPLEKIETTLTEHRYWEDILSKQGCQLVSSGTRVPLTPDAYAPSGSFHYLLRACIDPTRLDTGSQSYSTRNCSRFVTISPLVSSYTNQRQDKSKRLAKAASAMSSKMEQTAAQMRTLSERAVKQLNDCATANHLFQVNKTVRDSWVTMAAVGLEIVIELASIKDVFPMEAFSFGEAAKYYGKTLTFQRYRDASAFQQLMDLTQLGGAFQGYLFADTLKNIFANSGDMVRRCATYEDSLRQLETFDVVFSDYTLKYIYFRVAAEYAAKDLDEVAGVTIEAPADLPLQELERTLGIQASGAP
ncbi:MAG: hypothetical protein OXT67_14165 [Zetaproteobacteria bacterium]|nr:hypothetical protein [Zetaproteobacteria bacterium]